MKGKGPAHSYVFWTDDHTKSKMPLSTQSRPAGWTSPAQTPTIGPVRSPSRATLHSIPDLEVKLYQQVHDHAKTKLDGFILHVPTPLPLDLPLLFKEKKRDALNRLLLQTIKPEHLGTILTVHRQAEPLVLHTWHPFDAKKASAPALQRTSQVTWDSPMQVDLLPLDKEHDKLLYFYYNPRRHFVWCGTKGIHVLNREFMFQFQGRRPTPLVIPEDMDPRSKRQLVRHGLAVHGNRYWDPVLGRMEEMEYDENYAKMFGLHVEDLLCTHNRSVCEILGCHENLFGGPDTVTSATFSAPALEVRYPVLRERLQHVRKRPKKGQGAQGAAPL
jgi:hypothetical protein